jgi:GNAT superfamily N-acetyltransferase
MGMEARDELGHLNLIEFSRESARWGVEGSIEESDGIVLFATGSWLPVMCNGAFRAHDGADPVELVRRADAFFAQRGRGYTVMVRDLPVDEDLRRACLAAGLDPFGSPSPQMVCTRPVADPPPDSPPVRWVTTADGLADFAAVNGDAYGTYGMPAEVPGDVFGDPDRFLAAPHVFAAVTYDADVPVAAALGILSHGIAGIYWVGTVGAARRRGLGRGVTSAVTNEAFGRGARAVTLQASVMGEPVYRDMGYVERYRYTNHVRFTSRAR